jgi:hypothetical protein
MQASMLDVEQKQAVRYCIDEWLRDEQIAHALKRPEVGRIQSHPKRPGERVAVVGYGPSLKHTWHQLAEFKYIITCSGSHKYLIERGIIPTWHVEVDPRKHKIALLGEPHPDVTYLPASCCHPKYFDHLVRYNSKIEIWHVYDTDAEAKRKLPINEWAITGGCNVGLRAMTIARFFGFQEQHIFGMDGNEGEEIGKKHADAHPMQDGTGHALCEYPKGSGKMWRTTPGLLESAKQTFHELDMMPDVKAVFYGEGLVQTMFKDYVPKPVDKPENIAIAMQKPELISATYRELNAKLHRDNLAYGVGGGKHAKAILEMYKKSECQSILDYGCGKGYLAKEIPFPIWEYDPAIPGKDEPPRPADLVVCADVLEHIEPDKLFLVLDDLRRCVRKLGYFIIHTGPSGKTLEDGRNSHLIQKPAEWWAFKLKKFFTIGKIFKSGPLVYAVVGPK